MKNIVLSENDMHQRISEFIIGIRQFANNEFKNDEWFFSIIYGSYAYKIATPRSDIDILFVCTDASNGRIARAIDYTSNLHHKYSMPLDNEIPYDKKIVLNRKFFESACSADGVYRNNQWQLPVIKKNPEYLSSDKLLLRFFLGMMFNRHIFITGDYAAYSNYALIASQNLLRAIICINKLKKFTSEELVQYFYSNNGVTGDLFIGFSNKEIHITYLLERVEAILSTMPKSEIIKNDDFYEIVSNSELKPRIIC